MLSPVKRDVFNLAFFYAVKRTKPSLGGCCRVTPWCGGEVCFHHKERRVGWKPRAKSFCNVL